MLDTTAYPTVALYLLLAVIVAGTGIGVLVYQTGASRRALATRRSMLVGGVLLVLIGALVGATQVYALVVGSYS